ncbi:MAG: hypothetical protein AAF125_00195 [Chloroflexota bacterium]
MNAKVRVFILPGAKPIEMRAFNAIVATNTAEFVETASEAELFIGLYSEMPTATGGTTTVTTESGFGAGRDQEISGFVNNDQKNQSFNIGSINADVATVGRDMTINGGIQVDMSTNYAKVDGSESIPEAEKAVIKQQLQEFEDALVKVPVNDDPEVAAKLEATKQIADEVVDDIVKEKRNWWKLDIKGESLQKAAATLKDIAPDVLATATAVVTTIGQMKAMGM